MASTQTIPYPRKPLSELRRFQSRLNAEQLVRELEPFGRVLRPIVVQLYQATPRGQRNALARRLGFRGERGAPARQLRGWSSGRMWLFAAGYARLRAGLLELMASSEMPERMRRVLEGVWNDEKFTNLDRSPQGQASAGRLRYVNPRGLPGRHNAYSSA